jgi:hypothetical protein
MKVDSGYAEVNDTRLYYETTGRGHRDQIKKEDKALLDEYGFTVLFKEFDVGYVNVTRRSSALMKGKS